MTRKTFLLPLLLLFFGLQVFAGNVRITYTCNPLSDYLFYLFYRQMPPNSENLKLPDLSKIPQLNTLIALPEIVAAKNVRSYTGVYKLAEMYRGLTGNRISLPEPCILVYGSQPPDYDTLMMILSEGEKHWPEFEKEWYRILEGQALATLAGWEKQDSACHPFSTLEKLANIPFRDSVLTVACLLFHPAGSCNYSPPGIFTRPFKRPNLPWVLGHEGTHLLVSKWYGKEFSSHPSAPEVYALTEAQGLRPYDLEEITCVFMQITLAKICGTADASRKISAGLESDPVRLKLVMTMEEKWNDYLADPSKYGDITGFTLECAKTAFSANH